MQGTDTVPLGADGGDQVLVATQPPRLGVAERVWPRQPQRRRLAGAILTRLALLALLVGATFATVPGRRTIVVVAALCAAVLVVGRLTPRVDEPPVHDRQLDYLLTGAFWIAAVWLAWGWPPEHLSAQWLSRVALVAGGAVALVGTRNAARLWPSLLALTLGGLLPDRAWWVLAVATIVGLGWALARRRQGTGECGRTGVPGALPPSIGIVLATACVAAPSLWAVLS